LIIRAMEKKDLTQTSQVHKLAFVRQHHSLQWLERTFSAFPRTLCYVSERDGKIEGYIIWSQKSGFRPEAVLELEQIAVLPDRQGKGIGEDLIFLSLPLVKQQLAEQNSVLKHIMVTTRADNHAQKLYRKTLGVEVETTIKDLYSADEVLMVARHVSVPSHLQVNV